MRDKELARKIKTGILWSVLGIFFSKGGIILSLILVARIVEVEEYGRIGIIRNFMFTASMIALASFGMTATKYVIIYKEKSIKRLYDFLNLIRILVVILATIIAAIVLIFSEYISKEQFNNTELSIYLKYASVGIFFTALNGFQIGVLSALEEFKKISKSNILAGVLSLLLVPLAAFYLGGEWVIIAISLISGLNWLVLEIFIIKSSKLVYLYKKPKFSLQDWLVIKNFTFPMFLSNIVVSPVIFFLQLSLTTDSEAGYIEIGIYFAAFNLSLISLTLTQVINQVFYPYTIKTQSNKNSEFHKINIILPWLVGIFINLPIIFLPEAFALIYGENYQNEGFYTTAILIALSSIIISYKQAIARILAAKENMLWWSVLSNLTWGAICILYFKNVAELDSVGIATSIFIAHLLSSFIFITIYIKNGIISKSLFIDKKSALMWLLIFITPVFNAVISDLVVKILFLLLFIYLFYKTGLNSIEQQKNDLS